MKKPRLIYYNDGHHFHGKRVEPPVSIHMLQWPVDELLGTGVDLLVLGMGYGDVYFHNSKIGRSVGQKKEVWKNFIDWRIMRMVQEARNKGTDQVREVIKRGRETGLMVFPSLRLQDTALPGAERCGWLRWERGEEVCLREKDEKWPDNPTEWCYDYTNELVRQDKMAMIREMLEDYEADGVELDFMFFPLYFRKAETGKGIPIMNKFVADVREMANEIGDKQGRMIPIMARVDLKREDNLSIGLDVETWLKEKSIDLVVGSDPYVLTETGVSDDWLADVANAAGALAYYRPPRRVYDERVGKPSIEMFRALGQTLQWHGWAGLYDGYYPWPFADREYQILREMAYPEAHARKNKRYVLQPREGEIGKPTTTPHRQLPVELEEGKTATVKILVADDIESAKKDGEMRKPLLTIRFSFYCIEDDVEIRFNGRVLPFEEAEITDERALNMQVRLREFMPIQAPLGMSAHWFRYRLDVDDLKRGENTLEIETKKQSKAAGFARSVNGVEIQTRYKDFERPLGLGVESVAPA